MHRQINLPEKAAPDSQLVQSVDALLDNPDFTEEDYGLVSFGLKALITLGSSLSNVQALIETKAKTKPALSELLKQVAKRYFDLYPSLPGAQLKTKDDNYAYLMDRVEAAHKKSQSTRLSASFLELHIKRLLKDVKVDLEKEYDVNADNLIEKERLNSKHVDELIHWLEIYQLNLEDKTKPPAFLINNYFLALKYKRFVCDNLASSYAELCEQYRAQPAQAISYAFESLNIREAALLTYKKYAELALLADFKIDESQKEQFVFENIIITCNHLRNYIRQGQKILKDKVSFFQGGSKLSPGELDYLLRVSIDALDKLRNFKAKLENAYKHYAEASNDEAGQLSEESTGKPSARVETQAKIHTYLKEDKHEAAQRSFDNALKQEAKGSSEGECPIINLLNELKFYTVLLPPVFFEYGNENLKKNTKPNNPIFKILNKIIELSRRAPPLQSLPTLSLQNEFIQEFELALEFFVLFSDIGRTAQYNPKTTLYLNQSQKEAKLRLEFLMRRAFLYLLSSFLVAQYKFGDRIISEGNLRLKYILKVYRQDKVLPQDLLTGLHSITGNYIHEIESRYPNNLPPVPLDSNQGGISEAEVKAAEKEANTAYMEIIAELNEKESLSQEKFKKAIEEILGQLEIEENLREANALAKIREQAEIKNESKASENLKPAAKQGSEQENLYYEAGRFMHRPNRDYDKATALYMKTLMKAQAAKDHFYTTAAIVELATCMNLKALEISRDGLNSEEGFTQVLTKKITRSHKLALSYAEKGLAYFDENFSQVERCDLSSEEADRLNELVLSIDLQLKKIKVNLDNFMEHSTRSTDLMRSRLRALDAGRMKMMLKLGKRWCSNKPYKECSEKSKERETLMESLYEKNTLLSELQDVGRKIDPVSKKYSYLCGETSYARLYLEETGQALSESQAFMSEEHPFIERVKKLHELPKHLEAAIKPRETSLEVLNKPNDALVSNSPRSPLSLLPM